MKQHFWRTDRELAKEPDFHGAMKQLRDHAQQYWDEDQHKDAEEVEDFCQYILDRGYNYDDLSDGQQALLGVIRRKHAKWMRTNGKDQHPRAPSTAAVKPKPPAPRPRERRLARV